MSILDRTSPPRHLLGRVRGARLGRADGPARVLSEMRELGIRATEAGPDGYLGRRPGRRRRAGARVRAAADRRVRADRAAPAGALEPVERAARRCSPRPARTCWSWRRPRASRATTKPVLSESEWDDAALRPGCRPGDLRRPGAALRAASARRARWSRARPRSPRCWSARPWSCAWTPATWSSAATTRSSWRGARRERVSHVHLKDVHGALRGRACWPASLTTPTRSRRALRCRSAQARSTSPSSYGARARRLRRLVRARAGRDARRRPAGGRRPGGDVRESLEFLRSVLQPAA